jgi:hypothetical protein
MNNAGWEVMVCEQKAQGIMALTHMDFPGP